MKKKIVSILVCLLCGLSMSARPLFGDARLFVNDWRFKLQDDAVIKLDANVEKWRKVTLPHDWSVEGKYSYTFASATGYLPGGMGWYAKSFTVPQESKGKKVFIYFEGVYNRSKVYLNGHLLGERPNGYVSFMYDLTPYLRYGDEVNDLRVQVDHTKYNDSRWYTGSGIYRDVYLVTADPTHVDLWGTYCITENVTSKKADFVVQTTLRNEQDKKVKAQVELTLSEKATGKLVAQSKKSIGLVANDSVVVKQVMKVKSPKMWSIKNPQLYTLRTTLYVDGKPTETNEISTGVRTLRYDPNEGFFLNGENTKLKGVCIHHDAGCLGAAVPREVWKRRLERLQDMGCNAIRMSHNPQAPDVYELCDEMGFVVMDEAFDEWEYPKRKWVEGWNVGKPGYDGSADFFNEWCERDLRDMILRDRNHPSIIMWSIGNEVDYPNDPYSHPVLETGTINQPVHGGYLKDAPKAERLSEISAKLAKVVKTYDLSRPVTAALAGVIMSNHTDYPFNVDICGYNYTENRYELDHKTYPNRVIYGSETGRGINEWKAVRDSKYIFAQFIWTGLDYLGESGRYPSRGLNTGMIDFAGFLKPEGYLRKVMWSEEPVAYVGTTIPPRGGRGYQRGAQPMWNYRDGMEIAAVASFNTPYARLVLNGKVVGEERPYNSDTYMTSWVIPYEKGTLTVEGLNEEREVVTEYTLKTTGRPDSIAAQVDNDEISCNRGVAQIEIQIVDENGLPVFLADNKIQCMTFGPIRLLGLESGSNSDMTDNKARSKRVHNGRLVAYVQATGEPGRAGISFTSAWLKPCLVKIEVK
ncbi:MAG: DUF4982 domain-containing protein [Paraprevotella sp.]|nr:DUF4982 domain-containing protein [Paraprevotella sp.]